MRLVYSSAAHCPEPPREFRRWPIQAQLVWGRKKSPDGLVPRPTEAAMKKSSTTAQGASAWTASPGQSWDTSRSMYKRVVLKLSGEALAAGKGFGVDVSRVHEIAGEIAEVTEMGVELAVVVGGGNFFRGVAEQARAMDRVSADNMGMLATVINALAVQDAIEKRGLHCRVMSAIEMNQVAEPYIRRRAIRHLEKGRVVIFAAGIGNPYFSTDTAASLRAMEIKADVLLKATKVEGIYDADPVIEKNAVKFDQITYMEILRLGLTVMDTTAVSLCKDNNLPMIIFNLNQPGNIRRVISGEKVGSLVTA